MEEISQLIKINSFLCKVEKLCKEREYDHFKTQDIQ